MVRISNKKTIHRKPKHFAPKYLFDGNVSFDKGFIYNSLSYYYDCVCLHNLVDYDKVKRKHHPMIKEFIVFTYHCLGSIYSIWWSCCWTVFVICHQIFWLNISYDKFHCVTKYLSFNYFSRRWILYVLFQNSCYSQKQLTKITNTSFWHSFHLNIT